MAHPTQQQAFEHRLVENGEVAVDRGSRRIYALIEPQEATLLKELLADSEHDEDAREVYSDSLSQRLTFAEQGKVPQSGEADYYV
jgi:hypothetical protein